MTFGVLYVCTGNICRSPTAELLFRGWLEPGADVVVSSAGVSALVGEGVDQTSALALAQFGIDATSHRAQQFRAEMANRADLVLTATREQRDIVMTQAPTTLRRTFTIKEFVRLSAGVEHGEPRTVVAAVAARRGHVPIVSAEADDIHDPYRAPIQQAKTVAEEITETVYATLDVLGFAAQRWAHTPPPRADPSTRPTPY